MNRRRTPAATLASVTALEGYDWVTFLALLPYISRSLLAGSSAPLLTGFVVFGAGFAARPVGGYIFGRMSDRGATRNALRGSIILGACATGAIAVISPQTGGHWIAAALLLISRLTLGIAHGGVGSVGNSLSYDLHRRSRRLDPTVLVYSMAALGKCVSLLVTLAVATTVGHATMTEWGWRLPFAFGALMSIVVLAAMPPRSDFPGATTHHTRQPLSRVALLKRLGMVVALTAGTTAAYNVWIAGAIPIAVAHFHISEKSILLITLLQTVAFALLVLACSTLIRRWSLPVLYLRASGTLVVASIPILLLTSPYTQGSSVGYIVGISLATVLLAGLCAALPGVLASLFPTQVRSAGSGVPYAIAVALIGGTAPGLREGLNSNYVWFAAYVVALCVLTTGAAAVVVRRAQRNGIEEAEGGDGPQHTAEEPAPRPAEEVAHLTGR